MPINNASISRELKVVILSAVKESDARDIKPILLQDLGDRKVVDYVLQNAMRLVSSRGLYIVVGSQQEEMRAHLGPGYQYINQDKQLGTGHAVLQLKPLLADFHGNLLILYGDTPLFRVDSIRGLLNRHRLCQADLTLMTAMVNQAYPYGRIIRDASGQIIDIIEAAEASPAVLEIRELNVGAYLVRTDVIFSALEKLSPSPMDGSYRLTDCVYDLIRSGKDVQRDQIFDPDEVQGINTAEDLA